MEVEQAFAAEEGAILPDGVVVSACTSIERAKAT
jgi:hypothetical protein